MDNKKNVVNSELQKVSLLKAEFRYTLTRILNNSGYHEGTYDIKLFGNNKVACVAKYKDWTIAEIDPGERDSIFFKLILDAYDKSGLNEDIHGTF